MELWNDFEGKVVDDQYRLGRLLAPKGRSAFFAAMGPKAEPLSLRLIESLNDEDEILARWRRVRDLQEEHLVRMLACGQTMLDGTHLVYAVMEPTDADLSEVLRERPLTTDETRAMAASVLAGLEVLHGAGLVHEHVEAASVLAAGEVIKLRSDCVREAPAGAQGETLRRRDTHDFAMLVGYALTQRRDAMQGLVPRQFEDLVRNGMSGTWGLKEMAALLRPAAPLATGASAAPSAARVPGGPAAPVPSAGSSPVVANGGSAGRRGAVNSASAAASPMPGGPMLVGSRGPGSAAGGSSNGAAERMVAAGVGMVSHGAGGNGAAGGIAAASARPSGGAASAAVATRPAVDPNGAAAPRSYAAAAVASALEGGGEAERLPTRPAVMRDAFVEEERRRRFLIPVAVLGAILLLVLVIWYFVRGRAATPVQTSTVSAPVNGTPADGAAGGPVAVAKPSAASATRSSAQPAQHVARPQAASEPVAAASGSGTEVWRVVAYTYARQEQAQGKVDAIAARHPELKAEVFSPSGRSPFLVTVGGWMSSAQAHTERERARRDGLPRDTYAQNYRGK